jgi:amidohydrolase
VPATGYLLKSFQIACFIGAASIVTSARAATTLHETLDLESKAIEARMIDWRRDIHQNPELGIARCERRVS